MKDIGSHIGHPSKFPIGQPLAGQRILDDPWIGHIDAGDIRPVFVDVRIHEIGDDRTGDIRTASCHDFDLSVWKSSVKARDNDLLIAFGQGKESVPAFFHIDLPVITKTDDILRIDKRAADMIGKKLCRQIFTS